MHQFDVVLKVLLRNSMARITGNRVVTWLPTELPKVQNLSVDLLGETADGELTQIEIQSSNKGNVPFRMLRYLSLIVAIHDRIPKQVLLYVGREPLGMESQFTWADGFIRYAIIDMHAVDGEPLLSSSEPSDNVLGILARLRDGRQAIRSILEKISRLPREQVEEYYQALLILAGLRELEETVQQEAKTMFTIDLSENKVLGPAYRRGLEEGQLELLRQQIERKFGGLPEWVEHELAQSSVEELRAAGLRLLDVKTLEDLFPRQ